MQGRLTKRRAAWPFWTALSLIVVSITVSILFADRPPFALMEDSRRAISAAVDGQAREWAPDYLAAAEDSLKSASTEFDRQVRRLMPLRQYDRVRTASLEAGRIARASLGVVEARRDSTRGVAVVRLDQAEITLKGTAASAGALEMNGYSRSRLSALDLAFNEGKKALKGGHFRTAILKADEVIGGCASIQHVVDDQLDDYQQHRKLWAMWANDTIQWSRKTGGVAILVRKLSRRCDVYRNGRLVESYPAELGLRWMGHKMRRGDKTTPEGRYHITKKKTESRYYKALEINYPNDDDQRRFRLAKARGIIPRSAGIGSLIMIHGAGGRGSDWTEGCVALKNPDIDELFRIAQVGTPVTIVGAWDRDDLSVGVAK